MTNFTWISFKGPNSNSPIRFFPQEIFPWKVIKINTHDLNTFLPYHVFFFFQFQRETTYSKFLDLQRSTSYAFKPITASWSGYMGSIAKTANKAKSVVSMLPIMKLHAIDPILEKQFQKLNYDTPVVTFNQELYIKAYEIIVF